ncbi:MAG TPA: hypothetical protein VFF06_14505 [Polyangia bacterium]|nr:hypothetical protein [Polyangia bacterium]
MRLLTATLAMVFSGCFSLKPGSDTADLAVVVDGGSDLACLDPTGFGGKGCYSCTPTTREQLLNACTKSTCIPYDNSTLGLVGGILPQLPTLDFAVAPPPDLGSSDLAGSTPADLASSSPACSSLTGGNIVYATGSSAAGLFLGNIAQPLENAAPALTVIYQSQGSCIGVNAIVTGSTTKMTGSATYWDPNTAVDPSSAAAQLKCQLDPAGVTADIGLSDVFATTCLNLPGGLDPSIKDFFGPVQVMNLIVPQNSTAQNISAEATYLLYGFGAYQNVVAPWTDPNQIFQRNGSSGTQNMIGATIGVPATHWYGIQTSGSSAIRQDVINAGSMGQDIANKTIGILSADGADPFRANLHVLAFQDRDQLCAFFPDSTPMALDKANVRDGHFANFGPLHMLAHVNGGVPVSANAATLLDAITGVAPPPGVDIIDLYAKHSLIPQCAMRVSRDADGGAIKPFMPSSSCSCYYTERATGLMPPPGCKTCSTQSDCPAATPNCNKFAARTTGYCEP